MQIITMAVIKGGTGKTATAAALAQAGVYAGKRVLAVDIDPQSNLTAAIGADQNQPGAYQLLNDTPAAQLIQHTEQKIDAIAGSPDLATIKTTPGSGKRLQEALRPLKDNYDLCVIDTPPQMGELVFNALIAATDLIIPLEADSNSLQGLYQITDIAHQLQRFTPELSITGTVITRYDARPKINKYMKDVIEEKGAEAGAPLLAEIRPGIAVREAMAMQQSLFEYAPTSKPAQDYMQLFQKVIKKS